MLRKYASLDVLEAWQAPDGAVPPALRRQAHRVAFDYDPRPGFLYVRSRMISSRTNDNHDTFPAEEIEKGYRTFLGKPVFVNHHNANHRRARGVVVAVALHRDRNPDGSPDTWVEGLMEVDAVRFPKLAKAILTGRVNRTSMGVDVEWSRCSACGNRATSPAEYCRHLPALKGKKIRRTNPRTGKVEEKLIHEICAGLSFFENSLLVEDPADPTAYFLGQPDARGLAKAASAMAPEPGGLTSDPSHCVNCGFPFQDPGEPGSEIGNWPHSKMPYLCNDCAIGATKSSLPGKNPSLNIQDKGGYGGAGPSERLFSGGGGPPEDSYKGLFRRQPLPARPWTPDDAPLQSQSARTGAKKREGGDHPFFEAHPVSADNIVKAYHETTDDEKALGKRWYADAHHVATGITGGNAALGAGLLSAYSPLTAWPVNMFNASRAAQGDPPGPGTGAMGSQQRSAMRMLAGEHHSQVLTMPKTAAFAHLIEHGGDTPEDEKNGTHKVVIDRHAISVAVGHRITKEEGERFPAKSHQHYEHVAQAYRVAAHVLSHHYGKKITPHEVQAATWLGQVRKNQAEDSSGQRTLRGRTDIGGPGRVHMHENARERWERYHKEHHPGAIGEENMHYRGSLQVTAYGETRVPPQVDTLRMEECPVCGEHDVWSGDRCPVCGFVVPPSLFRDPDTSKAREVRQELDEQGEVTAGDGLEQTAPGTGPDGQIGSGEDADEQLLHPDQVTPNGVPVALSEDEQPPEAEDEAEAEEGEEAEPGEEGEEPLDDGAEPPEPEEEQAEGEAEIEQGQEEQEEGQELEAEGEQEEQEAEGEEEELVPQEPEDDLECPACGSRFAIDATAQPGVPCPACGMANLVPLEPAGGGEVPEGLEDGEDGEEPEDEEDEGEEPGGPQKDQEASEDEEEDKMANSKTGAALARAQASRIAELTARNEALEAQLTFLARAAGVDHELEAIRAQVMQRHADMLNPASPVPDPPQAPPSQTTQDALMSGGKDPAGSGGTYPDGGSGHSVDDPSRPGAAPGANQHVPSAQTTTAITPGVEMQTPPATNLQDVTAPVQGTNPSQDGGVPIQQRRIETDVRIDPDPLKASGPGIGGEGDNGTGFPWLLQSREPGQRAASLQPVEGDQAARTFASIRLARLRVQAGLAQGDELAVAEGIEKDAALPTAVIEHEIGVLSRVRPPAPPQRPMQRAAARSAPSLVSTGAMGQYAPAAADDLDGADLFL